jgi:hypothetical protein
MPHPDRIFDVHYCQDGHLVEIEQSAGVGSTEPADREGGGFAGAEAES